MFQFKERDFLEGIFKFWRNKDTKLFEAEKIWLVLQPVLLFHVLIY